MLRICPSLSIIRFSAGRLIAAGKPQNPVFSQLVFCCSAETRPPDRGRIPGMEPGVSARRGFGMCGHAAETWRETNLLRV